MMDLEKLKNSVLDGESNPLEAWIALKRHEGQLKDAMAVVQSEAIDEAQKYGEKSFKAFGATVEVKNAAGRWDYSKIGMWSSCKESLKLIEEGAKEAYHSSKKQRQIVDDDGEVIQPASYKEGRATIAIRLS